VFVSCIGLRFTVCLVLLMFEWLVECWDPMNMMVLYTKLSPEKAL